LQNTEKEGANFAHPLFDLGLKSLQLQGWLGPAGGSAPYQGLK